MEWVTLAIGGWLLASVAAAVVIGVAIRRAERRAQDGTTDSWDNEVAPPAALPPAAEFPEPRRPPQPAPPADETRAGSR